jgi:catechol 2,3-dioxygenase-like lactoylglutathione lyase family enzyme
VNGLDHWTNGPPKAEQVFIRDPNGNLIELHEIGRCRCVRSTR